MPLCAPFPFCSQVRIHHCHLVGQKTLLVLSQFTFSNLSPFSYHFLPSWNPYYLASKQFWPNRYPHSFPSTISKYCRQHDFLKSNQCHSTTRSFHFVSFTCSTMSHWLNLLFKFLNNTAFFYLSRLNSIYSNFSYCS